MRLRRKRTDLTDSANAMLAADESHQLAEHQLAHAKEGQGRSRRLTQSLREHNEANHFDDWLLHRVLGE